MSDLSNIIDIQDNIKDPIENQKRHSNFKNYKKRTFNSEFLKTNQTDTKTIKSISSNKYNMSNSMNLADKFRKKSPMNRIMLKNELRLQQLNEKQNNLIFHQKKKDITFTPKINKSDLEWKWDEFHKKNKDMIEDYFERIKHREKHQTKGQLSDESVKILIKNLVLTENSFFIDLQNKEHREILFKKYNDFHLRLGDLSDQNEKQNTQENLRQDKYLENLRNQPLINEKSKEITSGKISNISNQIKGHKNTKKI